ncbi:xylulokinase [Cohnella hashimotonis]|uniref:FGGY family carbohydrate kinase n=1 Tax=Cohnella hashimotonis TaxID=2826895 RepID=A0ABT6TLM7_9BACL|nr:FGGY family carbohydrate kinase [Cohnella hashimotonis]MDI4647763.1 FGGY family carbohydrate kinase [Cohnella hashimotonis]
MSIRSDADRSEYRHRYTIGLDLGTSAVKGVLLSAAGEVVARARTETRLDAYPDGRVEFDAEALFGLTADAIRQLSAALPADGRVAGLCMASASGNTVLLNERGEPMRPAISWMDARVKDEMDVKLGKLTPAAVHERTGWPLLKAFPLAHLSWLSVHEPDLLKRSAKVGMSTEYMLYRLTGEWAIDPSQATTFYLQDQQTQVWHAPYLRALGIPEEKLPRLVATGSVLGRITDAASALTGLPAGTPVAAGCFDHPAAARGAGVLDEGGLLLSCGTSWVGFTPLSERSQVVGNGMLTDPFLQPNGPWGAMFSLPAIAVSVDRIVREYISDAPDRYESFSALAAAAAPGARGLLINPLLEAGTGRWKGVAASDLASAVMAGTAYLLQSHIDRLARAGIRFTSVTMVGGPSDTHPWPQIVADVLGVEVHTVNGSCAGAAGAALLATVAAGLYPDEREAFKQAAFPKLTRRPDREAHEIYVRQYEAFARRFPTE